MYLNLHLAKHRSVVECYASDNQTDNKTKIYCQPHSNPWRLRGSQKGVRETEKKNHHLGSRDHDLTENETIK